MDPRRRHLLKGAASLGTLGITVGAGLVPATALADWPAKAFGLRDERQAIDLTEGEARLEMSRVSITAPDIAENGAVVPVSVESDLPNVVSITLFAEKNPFPLNSEFQLGEGVVPYVSTRVRLAESQHVTAVAKTADGKLYGGKKLIKVTIGGCGG
ncbi:MAG TPA: thiosulfate oxidation carrier protein SoxY [Usitatibacter sp.]|nr:thiosulfate oxidation carrier protein SoxY [Usitatibacter sp.]